MAWRGSSRDTGLVIHSNNAPVLTPFLNVGGLFTAVLLVSACQTFVEADTTTGTDAGTGTSTSADGGTSTSADAGTSTNADADTSTNADADTSTSTDAETSTNADADSSTSTDTDADTCSDGVTNGDESDIDCGGSECERCEVGMLCNEELDCASQACGPGGACAAVLTVTGTLLEAEWLVTQYAGTDQILRLDFAVAPEAVAFDGLPVMLALSAGEYVSSGISTALTSPELALEAPSTSVAMAGATGVIYYQSISPSYFGVIFEFTDSALANSAADLLTAEAAAFEGAEVTLRLADINP